MAVIGVVSLHILWVLTFEWESLVQKKNIILDLTIW